MGGTLKLVAIYILFMSVLLYVLRLKNRIIHQRFCRQYPGYDRELTPQETGWIDQLNQKFKKEMATIGLASKGVQIFILLLITMLLMVFMYMSALTHFRAPKVSGTLTIRNSGYTIAIAMLLSLIFACMPHVLAAKFGREKVRTFFVLAFSWNREPKSSQRQWTGFIEHRVRKRSISTDKSANQFDFKGLVETRFSKFWRVYIRVVIAACIILIFGIILERYSFSRVSKDHIEINAPLKFSSLTYDRTDIVSVDRLCFLKTGTERYLGPKVSLVYRLNFRDGKNLNLINGRAEFIKRKTAYAQYWQNRLDSHIINDVEIIAEKPIAQTEQACRCAIMRPATRRVKYAHKIAKLYGFSASGKDCE